jgi:hypothetical protein
VVKKFEVMFGHARRENRTTERVRRRSTVPCANFPWSEEACEWLKSLESPGLARDTNFHGRVQTFPPSSELGVGFQHRKGVSWPGCRVSSVFAWTLGLPQNRIPHPRINDFPGRMYPPCPQSPSFNVIGFQLRSGG